MSVTCVEDSAWSLNTFLIFKRSAHETEQSIFIDSEFDIFRFDFFSGFLLDYVFGTEQYNVIDETTHTRYVDMIFFLCQLNGRRIMHMPIESNE